MYSKCSPINVIDNSYPTYTYVLWNGANLLPVCILEQCHALFKGIISSFNHIFKCNITFINHIVCTLSYSNDYLDNILMIV